MRLSTTETTTALDTGAVVLMNAFEARDAATEIRAKFGDLRQTIHQFDVREGWRALGYDSFRHWAMAEIDQVSIRQVYRLLAAAEVETNLGVTIGHTPESQLRPLAQLEPGAQREAWDRAGELAGTGPRQAAHVAAAAAEVTDSDLKKLRIAIIAGPHRWAEAEQMIAALKNGQRLPWTLALDHCQKADKAMRGRNADRAYAAISQITDQALRESLMTVYAGAAQEFGLSWPTDKTIDPDRAARLIERAKALGYDLRVFPAGNVSFHKDGSPYGGAKDLDAAESRLDAIEHGAQVRAQYAAQLEIESAAPAPAAPDSIAAISDDLDIIQARMNTGRFYAGDIAALDAIADRLACLDDHYPNAEEDIETTRAALAAALTPPKPADPRAVHIRHIDELLAGLLQKLTPSELRLVNALTMHDVKLDTDDEDAAAQMWSHRLYFLYQCTDEELRWIQEGA